MNGLYGRMDSLLGSACKSCMLLPTLSSACQRTGNICQTTVVDTDGTWGLVTAWCSCGILCASYLCGDILHNANGACCHCAEEDSVNEATVALLLQMGVKSGAIANALINKYHRLPSIGTCFDVCVAGFALQGGLGLIYRYHGTGADFIQSMDVVTVG